jgi:hypothetical protein
VDTGDDIQSDANLAAVLNKTEFMAFNFHQRCGLSQLWGQTLLDMVGHPEFKPEHLQSTTIIHLLWRLELPFKENPATTYNFQARGRKSEIKLELVIHDYLDVFREIICYPRWKAFFDLIFRPIL